VSVFPRQGESPETGIRAEITSEALLPDRERIARGLGVSLEKRADQIDVLIGDLEPRTFARARASALEAEKPLCLVLPGPLPMMSERLPGSFVRVVIRPSYLAQHSDGIAAACAALLGETIQKGRLQGTPLLDLWRRLPEAGDGGLRARGMTGDGKVLQALLESGTFGPSAPTGFWPTLAAQAQGAGLDLDRVLEPVLQNNTVWFDPYDREPVAGRAALEILQLIESRWAENDRPVHCFGAQYWNHPSISATFAGRGGAVAFHDKTGEALKAALMDGGRLLSWAGRTSEDFETACAENGVELLRIEDGFLRSVGLGAGLAPGAMLAVDDQGIYYDPSRPSRLETLLETRDLSQEEHERGANLVQRIVAARVSKYNFGKVAHFDFPADRPKILVPGQVADDAAIRKAQSATLDGANSPNINFDLLKAVRHRNPNAFIIYKPHPDVETGLRKGRLSRSETGQYADHVASKVDIIDLIEAADAVETFSSLTGFEALLRRKPVTVHGLPFYAGWGLTRDMTVSPRRTRARSLAEIVYLALVVYARTIDPVTMLPCSPEFLIGRLAEQRKDRRHLLRSAVLRHASWLGRKLGL
jgi:capsular polysaccharide export protein